VIDELSCFCIEVYCQGQTAAIAIGYVYGLTIGLGQSASKCSHLTVPNYTSSSASTQFSTSPTFVISLVMKCKVIRYNTDSVARFLSDS